MASTIGPPNIRGSGSPARPVRSRSVSTDPWLTASYSAPCPRRCSGARHSPTSEHTGPSVHSSASVSSNSSSARRPKQPYSSPRKARSRSAAAAATLWSTIPTGFRLSITATADHFRASQLEGSSGGRPPARARTTPVQLTDTAGLNDKLRTCLITRLPGQPAGHGHDHGDVDHRLGVLGQRLVVADAAAVFADPGQGALHDPAAGNDLEAGEVVGALDDGDGEAQHSL